MFQCSFPYCDCLCPGASVDEHVHPAHKEKTGSGIHYHGHDILGTELGLEDEFHLNRISSTEGNHLSGGLVEEFFNGDLVYSGVEIRDGPWVDPVIIEEYLGVSGIRMDGKSAFQWIEWGIYPEFPDGTGVAENLIDGVTLGAPDIVGVEDPDKIVPCVDGGCDVGECDILATLERVGAHPSALSFHGFPGVGRVVLTFYEHFQVI